MNLRPATELLSAADVMRVDVNFTMGEMHVMSNSRMVQARPIAAWMLALTTLGGELARGQEITPRWEVSPAPQAAPAGSSLRIAGDEIRLTLAEAVEIALTRNIALRSERYARERARLGIDQAMGIYDFGLSASVSAAEDENPAASNLDGAEIQKQKRNGLTVGGSQLLPTGGVAGILWTNNRYETNSSFSLLNPSFSAGVDFSLTQPILQGFGRQATDYGIEVARVGDQISQELFTAQIIQTVQRVENAYWLLIAARDQLRVAEESLRLAQELHDNNRIRVEVGTLAPLELVSSEAQIATREEEIIRARGTIGDAEDLLFFLLNIEQGDAWSKTIIPETDPEIEQPKVTVEESIATALATRTEIAAQELELKALEIDQAFYAQDLKPRLDLKATYGLNGLGGDVLLRDDEGNVIGTLPGGWDDAMDQVTGWDFPGWVVGLEFSVPLQNRSAKARKAIADVALEQGRLASEQLELQITTEVRAAVRNLETSRQQLESARVSLRLAERNLDAERKKFDNGLSTSFQVLEIQDDLSAAGSRVVAATTGYRRALVEYYRATGKLLERSGVRVVS